MTWQPKKERQRLTYTLKNHTGEEVYMVWSLKQDETLVKMKWESEEKSMNDMGNASGSLVGSDRRVRGGKVS